MRLFALTFVVVAGCAPPRVPAPPAPTLTSELAAANHANQPLVIEFGATWCKPCRTFAEQVLPDPRVVAALRHVRFVQYDIDTPTGAEAMRRLDVTGVPAIVSLDRAGGVRQRKVGAAPSADELLAILGAARD